ncbi:MAG: response regulator transcription factor [Dysgonamonadaceae bacterium]|jgi:DNA-binding response OmpR family regulator|nr:response regulator transcription factor [Dysgonamonadaceae bacterium]
MAEKILVVDDGKNICEILEFNLSNEGYEVECAYSAEEALKKLKPEHSLILLDVMMGGISGYEMAKKLRKEANPTPIIFLTAKDTENDMLTGFSVGGDDYISKPFSVKEVIARVKAVLKRSETIHKKQPEQQPVAKAEKQLVFDDLTINFSTKEMVLGEEIIPLTRKEFELLTLLASNPTRVFGRDDIIDLIWRDAPYITERTIDVHIGRLRKKLGDKAYMITSRPGYGYRFNDSGK